MSDQAGTQVEDRRDGLDGLLCFDLYAASRAVTAAYRPVLERHGLTYPQYLVLNVLWSQGSCSIRHLAERLRLDHATLTPLLRRMEAGDLVERSRSTADERVVLVRPTARGRALGAHADDIQCRIGEAMGLTPDEVTGLQHLLRTVERHARRAGADAAEPVRADA